jgi:hypothetical protein
VSRLNLRRFHEWLLRRAFQAVPIAVFSITIIYAQPLPEPSDRERLILELNKALLGTNDGRALYLGKSEGWRGVVIAPPGTPLSAFETPFDALGHDTVSVNKLLEAASNYDRVLLVNSGIANLGAQSVAEVWEVILNNSRPSPIGGGINSPIEVLFKQPDEVDRARGVLYLKEPSPQVIRYTEYEMLYRMLSLSDSRGDGTWRLHPRLSSYSTIEEAKNAVLNDWLQYGYKDEVESARADYEERNGSKEWRTWTRADSMYLNNRLAIDEFSSVPQTLLYPPPSEWFGMASWFSGVSSTLIKGQEIRIRFQIARVRIERPWLDLEALLSGGLHVQGHLARAISDGKTPDKGAYPAGVLSVFPEELLLVRNIVFTRGDGLAEARIDNPNANERFPLITDHPLGLFSYKEQINLLGYVVRALPIIATSKQ